MPDLTLLQPWNLDCAWCLHHALIFTAPGVMPDKPPRGWSDVAGEWVCTRHEINAADWPPSNAYYPAVIEVSE